MLNTTYRIRITDSNPMLDDDFQGKKYMLLLVCKVVPNKNTLTRPANCKKTTRHHAHLSLCAKSRTTNDAKSKKWPQTSTWASS